MECLIDKSVNNHPKHYVNYHCLDTGLNPTQKNLDYGAKCQTFKKRITLAQMGAIV